VLGFLPAATTDTSSVVLDGSVFQSRAGFSPCRDPASGQVVSDEGPVSGWTILFQSRAGFSPCRDRAGQ